MPAKVAVIGNSHIGAIKQGWDLLKSDYPDVALDFMGSKSQTLSSTYLDGTTLKSEDAAVKEALRRSGGADEVDLARYDFILIIGLGVNIRSCARLLHKVRIHRPGREQRSGLFRSARKRHSPPAELVSRELLLTVFREKLDRTAARHLANLFTGALSAGVYLAHEPHLAEQALDDKDFVFLRRVYEKGMGEITAEIFERAFGDTFSDLAGVIRQPRDTVVKSLYTDQRYTVGGVGLKNLATGPASDGSGDRTHKNGAYGRRIVEIFLADAGLAGGAG